MTNCFRIDRVEIAFVSVAAASFLCLVAAVAWLLLR